MHPRRLSDTLKFCLASKRGAVQNAAANDGAFTTHRAVVLKTIAEKRTDAGVTMFLMRPARSLDEIFVDVLRAARHTRAQPPAQDGMYGGRGMGGAWGRGTYMRKRTGAASMRANHARPSVVTVVRIWPASDAKGGAVLVAEEWRQCLA
jgi:hypothetical protein